MNENTDTENPLKIAKPDFHEIYTFYVITGMFITWGTMSYLGFNNSGLAYFLLGVSTVTLLITWFIYLMLYFDYLEWKVNRQKYVDKLLTETIKMGIVVDTDVEEIKKLAMNYKWRRF